MNIVCFAKFNCSNYMPCNFLGASSKGIRDFTFPAQMFIFIVTISLGSTFAPLVSRATDKHECESLAHRAVTLHVYNKQNNCGIKRSNWHFGYETHYRKCRDLNSTRRHEDIELRERLLNNCREGRAGDAARAYFCTDHKVYGVAEGFGSKSSLQKKAKSAWRKKAMRELNNKLNDNFRHEIFSIISSSLRDRGDPGCYKQTTFPLPTSYNCKFGKLACANVLVCLDGYRLDGRRCVRR